MKTFKDIIEEATTEINQLPRRSKAFVDKHVVQKMDYPVDAEDQFTAKKLKKDKTKLASFHDGEDAAVYEETDLDEQVSFKKMESGDHHIHHNGNPVGRIVKTKHMGGSGYSVRFGGNTPKHEVSDESSLSAAKESAKWHLTSNESPLKKEEVDLDESVSNLSDARLKFHVLNNIPHGSYGKKEMSAEHLRRKKTKGPAYNAVKPSMNEETDLDEAKTDVYHQHMLKALGKTRLPKDHGYTSSIANNGDFVVRKGGEVAGRIPKGEHNLKEASMTPTDMKQRENIVKGMKKSAQDFKDRYGSKWKSVMYATATKAAMKESEQINELSNEKKMAYGKAAFADYHKQSKAKLGKILSGDKDTSGESRKIANRLKGISTSSKTEEVEQIDEISRDLARRYIRKVADKNNTGEASPKEVMKRSPGVVLAGKKAYGIGGKAKVNATESVDLDEAFKAGAMKLNDGSSVTLTSESSNALNNLFNQLSSQNKTKMEQRLMSGSKGFNEILAFAKEV